VHQRYLFDPENTARAHDKDGYFMTGDICRREGPYYFIVGRASVDIIKSGGYKISAIDIERVCLGLPYVSEVAVLGVDDEEFGQRVGAVISLKPSATSLTINQLRAELRTELAAYKLPTLLRVVREELPKGGTGKVQKKLLGPAMFPSHWRQVPEVQSWKSEKSHRQSSVLSARL
jgi:malonyl-CoA/methylmalonyl-CoA synthetase